jgi:cysteine desulfurase
LVGCDPLDLVWTSGATEGANQVFHHFARVLPADAPVWISGIEHPCVTASASHYFGTRTRLIPVTSGGVVDLNWIESEIRRERPGLVAVMAANNVTGVLQPWAAVAELCRNRETPFFCDAAQWTGRLSSQGLGACDFVSGCAHKAGGPRGIGFLKCPAKGRVEPLVLGGPQEEDRRAGTENVAGALALVAALEAREKILPGSGVRGIWRDHFEKRLAALLPGSSVVGEGSPRLWNTSAILMPEVDCRQRWVVKLDKLGFAVSTGSACSSGKEEPSPVLLAMGQTPAQAARMLRFSAGWETTEKEWDALLEGAVQAARELAGIMAA